MKSVRLATLIALALTFTAPLPPVFADDSDDIAAVQQWQNKAEAGDAEAQFRIGQAYALGQGFNQNLENAFEWYEKAAKQGHAKAQAALAILYVQKGDDKKTAEWLDKAAAQNEPTAQFFQGISAYEKAQDYSKAKEWWEKAAEQGNADAMAALATLYESGKGVPQDNDKASEWLKKASDAGKGQSSIQLANAYQKGELGLTKDDKKAFTYMEKAAFQGEEAAYLELSNMYLEGRGVAKNQKKARLWMEKETEQTEGGSIVLMLKKLQK